MKVRRGISFETAGSIWRKESLEADTDDYPEAVELAHDRRILYVGTRLEQDLLLLRFLDGNLTNEQYADAHARLDELAEKYLQDTVAA